jgi:hypothetical protein
MEPPDIVSEEIDHRSGNARHEGELVGIQRTIADEFGYVRRMS